MTKAMSKENISVFHPGKLEINSEIKWNLMMLGKGGFMRLWMFKGSGKTAHLRCV